MFLFVISLLLTPVSYAVSPPSIRSTSSLFRSHRSRLSAASFGRASMVRSYTFHAPTVAKMRRMRDKPTPHTDTNIHHKATGVLYDAAYVPDSSTTADGTSVLNTSIESVVSGFITSNTQMEPSAMTTPSLTLFDITTSNVLPYRTAVPVLPTPPPPRTRLHAIVVPIFVGSAVGAASLVLLTLLSVCLCRRMSTRVSPQINTGSGRWFSTDKKDDFIVSIRVPPPTVPLKGILLPSPSPTFQHPGDTHPDRVSLTSSQLSVIINNLPKAETSGSEHEALPPVKPYIRDAQIRATRIGPSPSDFLANLFGQANSFTSSNSASSHAFPVQPPPRPVKAQQMQHRGDKLSWSLTAPRSTIPQASISPGLGVSSGPRGHGLVLTGDQNVPAPSFAQWHHQRSMVRSGAGNVLGFAPLATSPDMQGLRD